MAGGLRERKRRRTRQEISDVATRLFFRHGFEEVTLAQIAEAADVSVKTIFNHFGSKEDLYFDRAADVESAFLLAVTDRAPGTTILGALRALLVDNRVPFAGEGWEGLEDPGGYAGFAAFLATEDRSPALRARRLTLGEQWVASLGATFAAELGRDPADPAIASLASLVIAVMQLRDRVLRAAMAHGASASEVRRRVTAAMDDAFDRLEPGFADLDRPR